MLLFELRLRIESVRCRRDSTSCFSCRSKYMRRPQHSMRHSSTIDCLAGCKTAVLWLPPTGPAVGILLLLLCMQCHHNVKASTAAAVS